MRHICRLGRTCRNCSHVRKDENGLYCVHDQWIGGWDNTRNPRNRAMKCSCFLNEKWNSEKWNNNDVMHWHYSEFLHKKDRKEQK